MASKELEIPAAERELGMVPLTLEGYSVLHQMFNVRWAAWNGLREDERAEIARQAGEVLAGMEAEGLTAGYAVLGHKADLMLMHFRDSFADLSAVEARLARLRLREYLEPASSYVSMIELGLYDSSMKLFRTFAERGIDAHSDEGKQMIADTLERQKNAMRPRLYPKIPDTKYVCFYPMDRRRGEEKNWYTLPIEDRGRQLVEHGTVGRRYADTVRQIITGSIGFDDWEWGVDLFAEDPLVYKKLITEMRYDEVSAVYSNFGTFYVGLRMKGSEFAGWMEGK